MGDIQTRFGVNSWPSQDRASRNKTKGTFFLAPVLDMLISFLHSNRVNSNSFRASHSRSWNKYSLGAHILRAINWVRKLSGLNYSFISFKTYSSNHQRWWRYVHSPTSWKLLFAQWIIWRRIVFDTQFNLTKFTLYLPSSYLTFAVRWIHSWVYISLWPPLVGAYQHISITKCHQIRNAIIIRR